MEWKHCLFFVTKRCYVLFSIKKRHWSNPLTAIKCTSMYIYVLSNVAITRIIYSTAINHSTNHASPSSISGLLCQIKRDAYITQEQIIPKTSFSWYECCGIWLRSKSIILFLKPHNHHHSCQALPHFKPFVFHRKMYLQSWPKILPPLHFLVTHNFP